MIKSPSPDQRSGHTAPVETQTRSRGPLVVAALAGVLHLVVGYFYLAGGLVAPALARNRSASSNVRTRSPSHVSSP